MRTASALANIEWGDWRYVALIPREALEPRDIQRLEPGRETQSYVEILSPFRSLGSVEDRLENSERVHEALYVVMEAGTLEGEL